MHKALGLLAIMAVLCSARVRAEEASSVASSNLSMKLMLGVGASVDAISSASIAQTGGSLGSDSPISYGFAAQYTARLQRSFAIGAAVGYLSWRAARSQTASPRNWLLDVAVLPEGRLQVADNVLLYVTVPLGVSLDVLQETSNTFQTAEPSNPALGFLIGGLGGARLHVAHWIGLFGELGYVYRNFSHELSVVVTNQRGLPIEERQNVTIAFGQFALNAGVCVFF